MSNNNNKYFYMYRDLLRDTRRSVLTLQRLAEAIILQSIEDLWEKSRLERRGSFAFFLGRGFHIWAELAGMTPVDRRTLLSLVVEAVQCRDISEAIPASQSTDGKATMPC